MHYFNFDYKKDQMVYSSSVLVAWRIATMTISLQSAIFALIASSSTLLINVPVLFASSHGWSCNKNVAFCFTLLWIELVFLVVIFNSLFC